MVRREADIKELSEQFVNVRLVKCNSLDLHLFQFDYDLTFGVFFLNPDKTIYARYGTRTGMNADDDVAIEGLAETMRAVLRLHEQYPNNAETLAAKQPLETARSVPEEYPSLDHFKSELDYSGNVAKSCIHCHQVRDAARLEFRMNEKPLPEKLLYPFPSAKVLGLKFDPQSRSSIAQVDLDTAAARAGFQSGDSIQSVDGNSIASEADFGWLLHNTESGARTLRVAIKRAGNDREIALKLPENWRQGTDLSWRPTSWDMRRMATGGMTLVPLNKRQRANSKIADGKMALRADHVGMYGNHARAKKAGLRKGDIIVSFDGRDDLMTENSLIEYAIQEKISGDQVEIRFQRNGKEASARIVLQ